MPTFHNDESLIKVRPDILNYGVTDFDEQMNESEDIILRTIESRWYRNVATSNGVDWRSTPFDATLMLNASNQLVRAGVYKSLELIYLFLMKEAVEPDAFERQVKLFAGRYKDEIGDVLTAGIDYDWDDSGAIDAGENIVPRIRRQHRV